MPFLNAVLVVGPITRSLGESVTPFLAPPASWVAEGRQLPLPHGRGEVSTRGLVVSDTIPPFLGQRHEIAFLSCVCYGKYNQEAWEIQRKPQVLGPVTQPDLRCFVSKASRWSWITGSPNHRALHCSVREHGPFAPCSRASPTC